MSLTNSLLSPNMTWSTMPPMPLPSVSPLHVDSFSFPPAITSPASSKQLFLGGAGVRGLEIEGKFVTVTVIGVYLDAMAVPSLSVKWKGKNAKELTESISFFRQLITGAFEKFTRVTMKVKLSGTQYSEKVAEYCEEILKSSGRYTKSEAKAMEEFLVVFRDQDFPPGSSIFFAICPRGSLTVSKLLYSSKSKCVE
ncbi:unnamed protein product [Microthlaspi erraticum]|uniref:Chalcone-flavonone isomerase family protein n=1 Tax=Microthlaspi erraticum TaxID=1685480 RepID=A0A6D2LBG9_9BRAS|nr:unnamed protein product [Microthlaspi erraticum]